jgi:hypothetical protein
MRYPLHCKTGGVCCDEKEENAGMAIILQLQSKKTVPGDIISAIIHIVRKADADAGAHASTDEESWQEYNLRGKGKCKKEVQRWQVQKINLLAVTPKKMTPLSGKKGRQKIRHGGMTALQVDATLRDNPAQVGADRSFRAGRPTRRKSPNKRASTSSLRQSLY